MEMAAAYAQQSQNPFAPSPSGPTHAATKYRSTVQSGFGTLSMAPYFSQGIHGNDSHSDSALLSPTYGGSSGTHSDRGPPSEIGQFLPSSTLGMASNGLPGQDASDQVGYMAANKRIDASKYPSPEPQHLGNMDPDFPSNFMPLEHDADLSPWLYDEFPSN
jgi:hypothetical protein